MNEDFTQSFDAMDWARAFVQTLTDLKQHIQTPDGPMPPDEVESWMLSWFANAIMRGWDEHARRYPPPPRMVCECDAERDAVLPEKAQL